MIFLPVYDVMKHWVLSPAWRKLRRDGDFVLVSDQSLEIHYLNATAASILHLADNRTLDEICHKMLEIYDVEPNVLQEDLINTVRELQWKRIVRISQHKN